jgi:hypothetical protein
MSTTAAPVERPGLLSRRERVLLLGLSVLAVYHLALAIFMIADPHAFYERVGPFEAYNPHYIRDFATFSAALGIGLAMAVTRPSWRVPMLAVTTVQFALHSLNHLLDIEKAHPAWTGYFDFFSLAAATALIAWLLALALAQARQDPSEQGAPP